MIGAFEGVLDESHVWGRYVERRLGSTLLLREIEVFPGGRTSIHRHSQQHELNFVAGGAIVVLTGDDPEALQEHPLETGGFFHVEPRRFHAVRFERGEDGSADTPARFFEVVFDFLSPEDIVRAAAAIAGRHS